MNFMLLRSFVVGCIDFRNMHCMDNKKKAYIFDEGNHQWTVLDFEAQRY